MRKWVLAIAAMFAFAAVSHAQSCHSSTSAPRVIVVQAAPTKACSSSAPRPYASCSTNAGCSLSVGVAVASGCSSRSGPVHAVFANHHAHIAERKQRQADRHTVVAIRHGATVVIIVPPMAPTPVEVPKAK